MGATIDRYYSALYTYITKYAWLLKIILWTDLRRQLNWCWKFVFTQNRQPKCISTMSSLLINMLVYDIYIYYIYDIIYANSFSARCRKIPFAISVHCRTSRQLNQYSHTHWLTDKAFSVIFALLFQTDLITIRAALGVQCSAVRNVRNAISELWHNFYAQTRCLLRWAGRLNARYR